MRGFRFQAAILGTVIFLLAAFPAAAQQSAGGAAAEAAAPNATSDGYVKPTIQNLSKLYWAIGKMDLDNNKDIDSYLFINDCDLYNRYLHDDLQWQKIRAAARQELGQQVASFPTRLEILIPIYLGRYDAEKQEFEVEDDSQYINTKKMDVNYNGTLGRVCGSSDRIADYPKNLILLFSHPFSFTSVPMGQDLASLYINYTLSKVMNAPASLRNQLYKRLAYLRLKVHIIQYKETDISDEQNPRAVVFGVLDGLEVYADIGETRLLYSEKIFRGVRHLFDKPGKGEKEEESQKPKPAH